MHRTVNRCHSGFVPPRHCSGGTNPLAYLFPRNVSASGIVPPGTVARPRKRSGPRKCSAIAGSNFKVSKYLIRCHLTCKNLPFPLSSQPRRFRRRRVRKVQKVPVYCHCRLPWDRRDTSHGSLAQCRKCKEWFHEDCANIPQDVFVDRTFLWCCRDCAVYL